MRKRDDDDFDYLYGIVTTHFLLYSPRKIYKASNIVYSIEFTKKANTSNSVKEVLYIRNVRGKNLIGRELVEL